MSGNEEPKLPGLQKYSNDQMFFISFAQVCSLTGGCITIIEMSNNHAICKQKFGFFFRLGVKKHRKSIY